MCYKGKVTDNMAARNFEMLLFQNDLRRWKSTNLIMEIDKLVCKVPAPLASTFWI